MVVNTDPMGLKSAYTKPRLMMIVQALEQFEDMPRNEDMVPTAPFSMMSLMDHNLQDPPAMEQSGSSVEIREIDSCDEDCMNVTDDAQIIVISEDENISTMDMDHKF